MNTRISLQVKTQNFVKEKRMALGLTQQKFAEVVFGDPERKDWVSKIENGRSITVDTLDRILSKLNCDIDFIEH